MDGVVFVFVLVNSRGERHLETTVGFEWSVYCMGVWKRIDRLVFTTVANNDIHGEEMSGCSKRVI